MKWWGIKLFPWNPDNHTDSHLYECSPSHCVCGGMYWPACISVLPSPIKPSHTELQRSVFFLTSSSISPSDTGAEGENWILGAGAPSTQLWFTLNRLPPSWSPLICKCVCLVFLVSSLLLWIMAWGFGWGLHPIHSSVQVYNCMHGWVIKDKESIGTGISHARPPSHWQEETSPTPWRRGIEDREITLGVLAASRALQRWWFGSEAKMNMSARAWKTGKSCSYGKKTEETMLLWLSYVSNQDLVPWI